MLGTNHHLFLEVIIMADKKNHDIIFLSQVVKNLDGWSNLYTLFPYACFYNYEELLYLRNRREVKTLNEWGNLCTLFPCACFYNCEELLYLLNWREVKTLDGWGNLHFRGRNI